LTTNWLDAELFSLIAYGFTTLFSYAYTAYGLFAYGLTIVYCLAAANFSDDIDLSSFTIKSDDPPKDCSKSG
jgi:hypothetical protein